jgi:hypothetical protein
MERGKRIGGSLVMQYGRRAFESSRINAPVPREAASQARLSLLRILGAKAEVAMRPGGHCLCICCIFWDRPAANFS